MHRQISEGLKLRNQLGSGSQYMSLQEKSQIKNNDSNRKYLDSTNNDLVS